MKSNGRKKSSQEASAFSSELFRNRNKHNRINSITRAVFASEAKFFKYSDQAEKISNIKTVNPDSSKITVSEILEICQERDLDKVFEIDLHGRELTVFPDLQSFKKLKILDLSGNHLTAICGLQFTKELKELKLYDNNIEVIDGLHCVSDLCSLQLQHNKIVRIGGGLVSLKNLKIVRLDSNKITKLEAYELTNCVNLTTLDISDNRLDSLSVVNCLPNLLELFASGNQLRTTGDLTKCKKLQEIDLSRNELTELSGLANLPNLQILDVSENYLTSLKSVKKLRSLEELRVNSNRIKELAYFVNIFPNLQLLQASLNLINTMDEIVTLSHLTDLCELYIMSNPLCTEEQEKIKYHKLIWQMFPKLEILDGIQRKSALTNIPLMRPMSASTVVSFHQVDSQLKSLTHEEEILYKDFEVRLKSLQSDIKSLDKLTDETLFNNSLIKNTFHSPEMQIIPKLETNLSRSTFVANQLVQQDSPKECNGSVHLNSKRPSSDQVDQHDSHKEHNGNDHLIPRPSSSDQQDSPKAYKGLNHLFSQPSSSDTPASSRCSSRFRIKEAKSFAARNFDESDDDERDLNGRIKLVLEY
ncbi:hypothetical protein Btru_024725 [Bulinus truncatus]|nr:hypothetical protein Btru_024725 [Bulinus truncatus]